MGGVCRWTRGCRRGSGWRRVYLARLWGWTTRGGSGWSVGSLNVSSRPRNHRGLRYGDERIRCPSLRSLGPAHPAIARVDSLDCLLNSSTTSCASARLTSDKGLTRPGAAAAQAGRASKGTPARIMEASMVKEGGAGREGEGEGIIKGEGETKYDTYTLRYPILSPLLLPVSPIGIHGQCGL
jgi:hypothetical protein